MDLKKLQNRVDQTWEEEILPTIAEYIAIPNKSPMFDPEWEDHGHMEKAVQLLSSWAKERKLEGMKLEVVRLKGRTPLIFAEIPGDGDETVLLYGHLDKQPEMVGWDEGKGPWTPVMQDGKLYGRGGADDGYAIFAALTAIEKVQEQGLKHARCVVVIEACEESGSPDLPAYIEHLSDRIGTPSLVVCLDSGCGNYEQLWSTTSLRGNVTGKLTIKLLTEGVHSGDGSGVVAESFRVARALLSRIEDQETGEILLPELNIDIPKERIEQAKVVADILGDNVYEQFPLNPGTKPTTSDKTELVLRRTWRPTLCVTGADGFPSVRNAGNVLRPETIFKLSFRLPPTADPKLAANRLKEVFETNPPYDARIEFEFDSPAAGWDAPPLARWLEESLEDASKAFFGKPACYMGEGGSIPFMSMLGKRYPKAQFLITGVLGPSSNAHGPNEFLHVATAKRVTACVAKLLSDHHDAFAK